MDSLGGWWISVDGLMMHSKVDSLSRLVGIMSRLVCFLNKHSRRTLYHGDAVTGVDSLSRFVDVMSRLVDVMSRLMDVISRLTVWVDGWISGFWG